LNYYAENRQWLTRLRIWVDCDGQRRPSSSFILATLSILEPQLNQLLPLIVDLSSNPDRIVAALGLNFNPDDHPFVAARLKSEDEDPHSVVEMAEVEMAEVPEDHNGSVKLLPAAMNDIPISSPNTAKLLSKMDEGCTGGRHRGRPEEQI